MKGKLKIKYHQAAAVYAINAVVFLIIFRIKAALHDFGIWDLLLNTIGIAMMGLFASLIYRGYRGFTMLLAGICVIRTGVTIFSVPFFTNIIVLMCLFQGLTCFMLARAALDIEIVKKIDY